MDRVFLRLNHENRTIISAVAQIISTVQKSGISRNMKYNKPLKIIKVIKNCGEFMFSFFLMSQLARNITYASLKNSEGWMLGISGIFSHHLAPLYESHNGVKTKHWKIKVKIIRIHANLWFFNDFTGNFRRIRKSTAIYINALTCW